MCLFLCVEFFICCLRLKILSSIWNWVVVWLLGLLRWKLKLFVIINGLFEIISFFSSELNLFKKSVIDNWFFWDGGGL